LNGERRNFQSISKQFSGDFFRIGNFWLLSLTPFPAIGAEKG
jgi:hypothetical protein